jgi:hypothetical protein
MSEQQLTTEQPSEETMSFTDKAAGVFYEPTKVFESIKKSGVKAADWFVPVLVLAIVASVSVYVRFSTPELKYQSMRIAEQSIDKMVAEGKISADQAQLAKQRMESGSSGFEWIGVAGALVATFIFFFLLAAVWFLVGKFALKGDLTYSHAMGIVGLSNWIAVVGVIIGIALSVVLARLDGGLNLGMLTTMNVQSKSYLLMARIDFFTLWSLFIVSVGLATLAGKRVIQSAAWVYGIWIVFTLVSVFLFTGRFA